jgi:hypothetical protein
MISYLTAARFIPDNRACGKLKAVAGVALWKQAPAMVF